MSHFGRAGPPDIKDTYSLLVLNISFRTSADDLYPLFDKCGKVVDIFIPRDRRTGESRGFAFVRYKYADEAQKAVDKIHGTNVGGREIQVQFAKYGPNAERIQKGRIVESGEKSRHRSRSHSPRRRSRDDYRDRDSHRRRSRSRSFDRHERDRYRGRDRGYRRRSKSRSVSPDYKRGRDRRRYDDEKSLSCSRSWSRSRSRSLDRVSPSLHSPLPKRSGSLGKSPSPAKGNSPVKNTRESSPISPRGRPMDSRSPPATRGRPADSRSPSPSRGQPAETRSPSPARARPIDSISP